MKTRRLDEEAAVRYGVTPGWWAFDRTGPILGPCASREALLLHAAIDPAVHAVPPEE